MDGTEDKEHTMRVDVIMPQMGESIAEGTLTRWLKKPGDKVARDEPIFEISTDKVDAGMPSPPAQAVAPLAPARQSASAPPGDGQERSARPAPAPPPPAQVAPPAGARDVPKAASLIASGASVENLRRVRSSPVVRKIAQEHDIDISRIPGTGASGRVTKNDILKAIEGGGPGAGATAAAAGVSRAAAPVFAPGERVTVVPMSAMRKKIAEHMVMSRRSTAPATT